MYMYINCSSIIYIYIYYNYTIVQYIYQIIIRKFPYCEVHNNKPSPIQAPLLIGLIRLLHTYIYWLVVLTILKNISQWEGWHPIFEIEKKMFETTNQYIYIYTYTDIVYIWVNYNISLTWIKAIWGWFLLLTMLPVREDSEVIIKFAQIYIIYIYIHIIKKYIHLYPSH